MAKVRSRPSWSASARMSGPSIRASISRCWSSGSFGVSTCIDPILHHDRSGAVPDLSGILPRGASMIVPGTDPSTLATTSVRRDTGPVRPGRDGSRSRGPVRSIRLMRARRRLTHLVAWLGISAITGWTWVLSGLALPDPLATAGVTLREMVYRTRGGDRAVLEIYQPP